MTPTEGRAIGNVAGLVHLGEWQIGSGDVSKPPVAVANAGTAFVLRGEIDESFLVGSAHAYTDYIEAVEKLISEQRKRSGTSNRSLTVVRWDDAALKRKAGIENDNSKFADFLKWSAEAHPDIVVNAQTAKLRTLYVTSSAITQSEASLPEVPTQPTFDEITDYLLRARDWNAR